MPNTLFAERVPLLIAVTVIAGESSHMPAWVRHDRLFGARVVTPIITAVTPTREHAR